MRDKMRKPFKMVLAKYVRGQANKVSRNVVSKEPLKK